MSELLNLKLLKNVRQSDKPANMVNSPLNGLFLKNRSKEASSFVLPDFQYAYAMVTWYRSVRRGWTVLVILLFEEEGLFRILIISIFSRSKI